MKHFDLVVLLFCNSNFIHMPCFFDFCTLFISQLYSRFLLKSFLLFWESYFSKVVFSVTAGFDIMANVNIHIIVQLSHAGVYFLEFTCSTGFFYFFLNLVFLILLFDISCCRLLLSRHICDICLSLNGRYKQWCSLLYKIAYLGPVNFTDSHDVHS